MKRISKEKAQKYHIRETPENQSAHSASGQYSRDLPEKLSAAAHFIAGNRMP